MGWWGTDEEGISLLTNKTDMVWGDGPADVMDDALREITRQFMATYDRLPSEKEIIAGVRFSMPTVLESNEGFWAKPTKGDQR